MSLEQTEGEAVSV